MVSGQTNKSTTTVTASDHNLIEVTENTGATVTGSPLTSDPQLGPLQANGGPTVTMAPAAASPAINAAGATGCPATDQRGVTRPQTGDCDIGAVERDTTAPSISIDSGPAPRTSSTRATLKFHSEAGATLYCALDNPPYTPCTSPKTYNGLSVGAHTFYVAAIDIAGNNSGAISRAWTVTAQTTITKGPGKRTTQRRPTFKFKSSIDGSTFECKLDSGRYKACKSQTS